MERPTDPYRTLGLTRGASLAEVKRAYRRLAKEWHPDAARARGAVAGPAAVRRFLLIQAAYQAILTLNSGIGAEAERRTESARRTDSARGWARRGNRAASEETGRQGARESSSGPETRTDAGDDSGQDDGARRAARLGTTSYDDAPESQPEWHGASWYGEASGTYWTVNPREYADPRKHGPEYLERTRHTENGHEA